MRFHEAWGWVRLRNTSQKLKFSVENIIEKYGDSPLPSEIETSWTALKNCIPRQNGFVIYFERPIGRNKQKVNLILNPGQENMGEFSIIEPNLDRKGKIVHLREKPFPNFLRYFEFETFSIAKSSAENLSWQLGIVKLPDLAESSEN